MRGTFRPLSPSWFDTAITAYVYLLPRCASHCVEHLPCPLWNSSCPHRTHEAHTAITAGLQLEETEEQQGKSLAWDHMASK